MLISDLLADSLSVCCSQIGHFGSFFQVVSIFSCMVSFRTRSHQNFHFFLSVCLWIVLFIFAWFSCFWIWVCAFLFSCMCFWGGFCFCVTQSSKAVQFRSKQFSLAVFFFWILDFPTTLSILSRGFFSVLLFSYCWLVWFVVVCRFLVSLSLFLDSVSFVFFSDSLWVLVFCFQISVDRFWQLASFFSVCGFSIFIVTGFLFFAFSSSVVHFRVVFAMFFWNFDCERFGVQSGHVAWGCKHGNSICYWW